VTDGACAARHGKWAKASTSDDDARKVGWLVERGCGGMAVPFRSARRGLRRFAKRDADPVAIAVGPWLGADV
jgi:hypothetical protein